MRSNSVSRPTMTGACHAMTIDNMTNHKGRVAITLYSGAAVLALAIGYGGRVGGESPSSTATPTTITTTRSPFSDLTEVPAPQRLPGAKPTAPSPDVSSADQKGALPASTAVAFLASATPRRPGEVIPPAANLPLTGPKRLPAGAQPELELPCSRGFRVCMNRAVTRRRRWRCQLSMPIRQPKAHVGSLRRQPGSAPRRGGRPG